MLRARNLFMEIRKAGGQGTDLRAQWKSNVKPNLKEGGMDWYISAMPAKSRKAADVVCSLIIDSGAGQHIISMKDLAGIDNTTIRPCRPISFETANGRSTSRKTALFKIRDLDDEFEGYILDNSPTLLSLGRLVTENGYRFAWDGDGPILEKNGNLYKCSVRGNCPEIMPVREKSSTSVYLSLIHI